MEKILDYDLMATKFKGQVLNKKTRQVSNFEDVYDISNIVAKQGFNELATDLQIFAEDNGQIEDLASWKNFSRHGYFELRMRDKKAEYVLQTILDTDCVIESNGKYIIDINDIEGTLLLNCDLDDVEIFDILDEYDSEISNILEEIYTNANN